MTDGNDRETRHRAEPEDLRASEIRYRRLFESARDGILILDAASRKITDVNPFMLEFLGHPREEILGRELWEIGLFKDRDASRAAFRELQATGYIRYEDLPLQTRAGKRWNVEFVSNVYTENGRRVVQCNVRDITGRKRQEEALRESENKYRLLVEEASDGIHTYDMRGHFIETNSKLCEMLGYTSEELLRLKVTDLIPAEDLASDPIRFEELRAGKTLLNERRLRRKDGALLTVEISGRMIRDNELQAIIRDITERKRAEDALLNLNEQLEQRVAERTAELTESNDSLQAEIVERQRAESERASILRRLVMAQEEERRRIARDMHDQFGQQLTVLLLKLGLLKEDCGEQRELREQVETLEEVAGRLDADVDFLVWQLRPTALDDLGLQDALTNFAQNWSKHFRIPVEVLAHGLRKESSTSEIDTTLYRIAQEALNNVAKHARAAGVTILLEGRADAVSLIIEDDGVGFDAENKSGAGGRGLGLVGMRERAALVGGTAEVESQPGEGTRVIVRIPAPPRARQGGAHE